MTEQSNRTWFLVCSALAGLSSGLLVSCVNLGPILGDRASLFLPGITFGIGNALCLRVFLGLRSIWKIAVFIAASASASYLSVLAAFFAHEHLSWRLDAFRQQTSPVGPETLFAGGFTGAFVILLAALLVVPTRKPIGKTLLAVFGGSLVGGLLGIAGKTAGAFVDRVQPQLLHFIWRDGGDDTLLIVLWPAGMSLLLSLMLWVGREPTPDAVISESKQT